MNLTFIPNRFVSLISSKDFRTYTAASDTPNWPAILAAIKANDEQALINAISTKETIKNFGSNSPNRGDIEIRGTQVLYRGSPLFGEDVDRIFSYLKNGFPHNSMIAFLEAKVRNISPVSVASLYNFLENKGMPITDNGTVLGYKGVRADLYSVHSGAEPLISGTRDKNGSILNTIGETVWMGRQYVLADNSQPCGPGLHIGSQRYAKSWGPRVMVVEFSPEHVVSVPGASGCEVLRVNKYRVVGESDDSTFLGNTYNNDFVRPTTAVEPDDYLDTVIAAEIDGDGFDEVIEVKSTVPDYKRFNISDWSKGQAKGFKDGKAHQKRMYYEEDRGRKFRRVSSEFVDGYLAGYRDGRG